MRRADNSRAEEKCANSAEDGRADVEGAKLHGTTTHTLLQLLTATYILVECLRTAGAQEPTVPRRREHAGMDDARNNRALQMASLPPETHDALKNVHSRFHKGNHIQRRDVRHQHDI